MEIAIEACRIAEDDLDDGFFLSDDQIKSRQAVFDRIKAQLYVDLRVVELSGVPALVFTE